MAIWLIICKHACHHSTVCACSSPQTGLRRWCHLFYVGIGSTSDLSTCITRWDLIGTKPILVSARSKKDMWCEMCGKVVRQHVWVEDGKWWENKILARHMDWGINLWKNHFQDYSSIGCKNRWLWVRWGVGGRWVAMEICMEEGLVRLGGNPCDTYAWEFGFGKVKEGCIW